MIRTGQTFKGELIDPTNFVLAHRPEAAEVFEATGEVIIPQALRELQETPGPVKYPIEWALSARPAGRSPNMPGGRYSKQKAAFYATDGFGGGIPHVRPTVGPGSVPGAWYSTTDTESDEFKFQIGNKDPGSKYLYGSLAKTNPGRFQQKMHINTGWFQGYRVVTFWMNAFGVLYRETLRKRYKEMTREFKTKRRAYTAPRRK